MISCIIVDDEQHSINLLVDMIARQFGERIQVMTTCTDLPSAANAISLHRPDLLFLDIQLDNGTSFDLLSQIDTRDINIIFVTAYEKYAIQAFRFSAVDYLLKPVDPVDFAIAVNKVLDAKGDDDHYKKIETLLKNIYNRDRQKLCIPDINGFNIVEINQIIRCEANINYTTIFIHNAPSITVAKSLKEFEKMLSEHHFFRLHNSHLVNLRFVKSYNKNKVAAVLSTGESIEISVRRKEEFLSKLMTSL